MTITRKELEALIEVALNLHFEKHLKHKLDTIMGDLTKLNAEIARTQTLEQQAITAIQNITPPVDDQPAIDSATATLKTANDALDAVVNPPPPPAP